MAVASASKTASVLAWDKAQANIKPSRPRNQQALSGIAIIVILLLSAAGLWRAYHSPKPGQWVQVIAAGRDIPAGVRLGFTTVRFLDVPKPFVTTSMVTSLNDITNRVTKTFIPAGEPIDTSMLMSRSEGLSFNLENHERAITLALNDDSMVDHLILPQDLVDVLAITTNNEGKKYTKTISQSVRVLISPAKEQLLARSGASNDANRITLAVSPGQAEAITEAVEVGKVRLVLRNRLAPLAQTLSGAQLGDLLPASASAPQPVISPLPTLTLPTPPPLTADNSPIDHALGNVVPPLQWLVEVVSGSHKESYGVPQR